MLPDRRAQSCACLWLEHFIVKWNHLTVMKMRKNQKMERLGCFHETLNRSNRSS